MAKTNQWVENLSLEMESVDDPEPEVKGNVLGAVGVSVGDARLKRLRDENDTVSLSKRQNIRMPFCTPINKQLGMLLQLFLF